MALVALLVLAPALSPALAQDGVGPPLQDGIRAVHDPVLTKAGDTYYLFSTGRGIPIRCSPDLEQWAQCSQIYLKWPDWVREKIPGATNLWAPDVSFFAGAYHVYYAVSTFGSNRSVIGLATNVTLDPDSADYAWLDHGPVLESHEADDWNAIDPNVVLDAEGGMWLAFGSYWSGIKLRRLDPASGMPSAEDTALHALAARPAAPHAIEAPFLVYRAPYYYLFVSFDSCCRGADSTYNVRVGRSEAVVGPYVDRDGVPMLQGGGTLLVSGGERWRGPGHQAVYHDQDQGDLLIYHAYDAEAGGRPTLRIRPLLWDGAGWPVVTGSDALPGAMPVLTGAAVGGSCRETRCSPERPRGVGLRVWKASAGPQRACGSQADRARCEQRSGIARMETEPRTSAGLLQGGRRVRRGPPLPRGISLRPPGAARRGRALQALGERGDVPARRRRARLFPRSSRSTQARSSASHCSSRSTRSPRRSCWRRCEG